MRSSIFKVAHKCGLVKKAIYKWQICIAYTDLNKICPKDCFPVPRLNQLVDFASSQQLLSFMGAFSGSNQSEMAEEYEIKTSFSIKVHIATK